MKFIKFLYKDIYKHKMLFLFLILFTFLTSFMVRSGMEVIGDFIGETQYHLRISKQYTHLDNEDRQIINDILISTNKNMYFVTAGKNGGVVKLIGDYGLKAPNTYTDINVLESSTLTVNDKKFIASVLPLDSIVTLPLADIPTLSNGEILELLNTISDKQIINNIAKEHYKTLKIHVKTSKDDDYEINTIQVFIIVMSMTILSFLILQNSLKFFIFQKYDELKIHQFYGSTILIQFFRIALYLLPIFILQLTLKIYMNTQINYMVDLSIFMLMYLIIGYYILQIYHGEDNS